MGKRKGILEEILSKASYSENIGDYKVTFRDFNNAKEVNLEDFIKKSNNFGTIPASRIILIKKRNRIIFRTTSRDLLKLINHVE